MKKVILLIFIMSISLFGKESNEFKKIDTFKAVITETSNLNNKKRIKEYEVLALLPDQLMKKMISPSINKGEIYLYNGEDKTIYYPILDQKITQKVDKDENYTLKFIRDLKSQTNDGDYKIIKSNNQIKEIIYNDGVTIKFESFSQIKDINFPSHVKIFDGKIEVSDLVIKNIEINTPISKKDFSIDEIIKNWWCSYKKSRSFWSR